MPTILPMVGISFPGVSKHFSRCNRHIVHVGPYPPPPIMLIPDLKPQPDCSPLEFAEVVSIFRFPPQVVVADGYVVRGIVAVAQHLGDGDVVEVPNLDPEGGPAKHIVGEDAISEAEGRRGGICRDGEILVDPRLIEVVFLTEYGFAQQGTVFPGVGRVAIVEVVNHCGEGVAARGPTGEIAGFKIPIAEGDGNGVVFHNDGQVQMARCRGRRGG
jgi:hypothetical protein